MEFPVNRQWIVRRRPVGVPVAADFEYVRSPMPATPDGAVLVRVHYCSLDPAIRGWRNWP